MHAAQNAAPGAVYTMRAPQNAAHTAVFLSKESGSWPWLSLQEHLLLYIEELQQEIDVRTYDMEGVELLKSGRHLLALNVPGLAEARPSVLRGDALYVLPADGSSRGKEYQGFVHVVQQNAVRQCLWIFSHAAVWAACLLI